MRRRNNMPLVAAIIAAGVISAGATVYSSAKSSSEQRKSQNKILDDARNKEVAQADKLAKAGIQAQQTAKDKAAIRRRAQTETILTSPLGVTEDATTSRPTILGG
jgi:cell division protein FtsB